MLSIITAYWSASVKDPPAVVQMVHESVKKKRYICSGYPKISITHSGCYGMRIFLAVREQEVGSQEGA